MGGAGGRRGGSCAEGGRAQAAARAGRSAARNGGPGRCAVGLAVSVGVVVVVVLGSDVVCHVGEAQGANDRAIGYKSPLQNSSVMDYLVDLYLNPTKVCLFLFCKL
jgi:hypothetical protein